MSRNLQRSHDAKEITTAQSVSPSISRRCVVAGLALSTVPTGVVLTGTENAYAQGKQPAPEKSLYERLGGVFAIAAAFTLAQLGTNIAANSISAGTDMAALLPRWISIRRGSYVCATVGLVMCPWNLLKDTNSFTTYLSAYSVFLSSIAGVMICDYYLVRRGYLQIKDLYSGRKTGPYYFTFGFHWRGYAAYIAGILINVVGFAGAVGRDVPAAAQRIYDLNFFMGFLVASIVYWGLCRISPVPATSDVWCEVGDEITEVSVAYEDGEDLGKLDEEAVIGGKGVDGKVGEASRGF